MEQYQPVHGGNHRQCRRQASRTQLPLSRLPLPRQQGNRQQGECRYHPRRQPEVNGFFVTAGGHEIRHTGIGKDMTEIEQADGQKSARQQRQVGADFFW